jgi:hypothetical protein
MAINPALLIAAPILQDTFVDNVTDTAMSAGIITCYQDNSRTTLKNWFYQSGAPGAYTYLPLANPLTLSAAGTITDPVGNDTIPFWYPYSELDDSVFQPYYVTVVDANGQAQFTRQNFPYVPQAGTAPTGEVPTLNNLITNGVFYHNIGSMNATSTTNAIIAPSQHDGFMAASANDIRFIKSVAGATDTLTFTPFGLNNDPLVGDITPEYYLNFACTAIQAGETFKGVQMPISLHIKTLENVNATFTIQAQNGTGNANNQLSIYLVQALGSNAIDPDTNILLETITLTNAWQKYTFNFTFPSSAGLTLGTTGDDGYYLLIGYPLSAVCNINFTLPSIYLSDEVPTNFFQTYDQIDTVINSPRTGDLRTSINNFQPFGWVLMNDGTIGDSSSNATTRANIDTWNLFWTLWNMAGAANAPMFTSAGTPVGYGVSASADWTANNQISLTKQLGRALASAGQSNIGGTTFTVGQASGAIGTTIAQNNLPASMTLGLGSTSFTVAAGGGTEIGLTGGTVTNVAITNSGGGQAINIYQPTTFYNVFMKL